MDEILHAIAEPRRREILELIRFRERSAGEIAACFDISRPAVSQHLRVLVEAGLVHVRSEGTRRLYRARPEGLTDLEAYLHQFWRHRLDQWKEAAETEERGRLDRGKRNE
ncbi:ArsR family transcriptional regulator [Melghirimyces profundicolus]|uniref:ArsR family transcriptional regulator n=1 Tax=Melghirimyces profundicolus TaxID=1242148 RepID=A0A2T6BUB7_9BACL|nr:ArsR family transcriptional regulator [Melghirimyces profundicolus]